MCLSDKLDKLDIQARLLPQLWADTLLKEISSDETVRDSTLRRSTGYALGLLSCMRSENYFPRTLVPNVLATLLKLSLQPESIIKARFLDVGIERIDHTIFSYMKVGSIPLVPDVDYDTRCRVHAMNILRLALLDAPLKSEIRKFVGDCMISAFWDTMTDHGPSVTQQL